MNSNGSSLTPWPIHPQAAAGDQRANPYQRRTASQPPIARRLFDTGSSASSSDYGNIVQTVQTQVLAVQTQVPPDTPEKALLKQRNEQLQSTVDWMQEHAEAEIYREKYKAYETLENALQRCKSELTEAVTEHKHQCHVELQAYTNQLSHQNEVEKQHAEMVYQYAEDRTKQATSRVSMLTHSEQDAVNQLQDVSHQLSDARTKLRHTEEEVRQQQLALQSTTEAANSAIQLRDQKIGLQKQVSDQEKRDLEQTLQAQLQNTKSSAEMQIKKEEYEKLDYKRELEIVKEQLLKERKIYAD